MAAPRPITCGGGIADKAVHPGPGCLSIIAMAGVFLLFACHRFIAAASGPFHGRHAFINTEQRGCLDVMASTSRRYSHGKSCGADIVRHLEYPDHVVVTERQPKPVDLASERLDRFSNGL